MLGGWPNSQSCRRLHACPGPGPGLADGKVGGTGAPLIADAEDVSALRTLAAAIEAAVRSRGQRPDAPGLDWDTEG